MHFKWAIIIPTSFKTSIEKQMSFANRSFIAIWQWNIMRDIAHELSFGRALRLLDQMQFSLRVLSIRCPLEVNCGRTGGHLVYRLPRQHFTWKPRPSRMRRPRTWNKMADVKEVKWINLPKNRLTLSSLEWRNWTKKEKKRFWIRSRWK